MTAVPRPVGPQSDTGHTAPKSAPARHGARVVGTVVHRSDPAAMAPAARIAELGEIFALGFRRRVLSRQRELAEPGKPEPSSGVAVNGNGAEPAQEAP